MEHSYKTFVSIGNAKQHFSRLLNAVEKNIVLLPKPILIQRGHTPFESTQCDVVDFVNMDQFSSIVQQAEVLIFHAGAGSVLHAIKAGKLPIIMPRSMSLNEHVNDHQFQLASLLHAEGKALMIKTSEECRQAIEALRLNKKIQTNNQSYNALQIINAQLEKILKTC